MSRDTVSSASSQRKGKLGISVDIPPHRFVHLPVAALWKRIAASSFPADAADKHFLGVTSVSDRSADEVAEALHAVMAPSLQRKLLVVDVRTSDCLGGHIPTAVNLPFESFESVVGALVNEYASLQEMLRSKSSEALAIPQSLPENTEATPAAHGIATFDSSNSQRVVFYDLYGKEQGPAAAQTLLTRFAQDHPSVTPPEVFVLTGQLFDIV